MDDNFGWAAMKAREAERDIPSAAIPKLASSIAFLAEGLKQQAEDQARFQQWVMWKLSNKR